MKKRIGNPQQFHVRLEAIFKPSSRRRPLNRATYSRSGCLLLLLFLFGIGQAQNVAINSDGSKPNPNAMLDIQSTSKGLLIPRMTTEARTKIPNTQGMLVYDINTNSFWYNTGKDWQNMSAAAAALATTDAWLLSGNAGTVDGVNFIGTTDNVPFNVRVNNQRSGRIDPATNNTLWGYQAGWQLTTGKNNTAIGAGTLYTTTIGSDNTVVGSEAMRNNTGGFSNAAFGRLALQNNTTGAYNVAIGQAALTNNTGGNENVAVGVGAIFGGSGNRNVCIGTNAMFFGAGSNNTALGTETMIYALGTGNTALGYQASTSIAPNINTSFNTAVGQRASNNEGSSSTAIGSGANTTGDNSTALGAGAVSNTSNKVRIGNAAVTVIEGQVPFTTPSDGRFKFAIQEDVKGLDFVMQLRPVTYQFDVKSFDGNSTNDVMYDEAMRMRRTGFIAQEVEQAAIKSGYNFSGIIKPRSASDHYSLSYDAFVVPLVKAMQEQQQIIEKQEKKLADMQAQIDELKKLLTSKTNSL